MLMQPTETVNSRYDERYEPSFIHVRLIPLWIKIPLFLFLACFIVAIGAMIGFGVIGTGNPWDVFKIDTWMHLYNLINP